MQWEEQGGLPRFTWTCFAHRQEQLQDSCHNTFHQYQRHAVLESALKRNAILSELLITLLLYASIDFNPLHSQEAQADIPL